MSGLQTKKQTNITCIAHNEWMLEHCVSDLNMTTTPTVLLVGDSNGHETFDVFKTLPNTVSVTILEHDATLRGSLAVTFTNDARVSIVDPSTYDFEANANTFDIVCCSFVLCRYPEGLEGPIAVDDFKASIDQLVTVTKEDGFLITAGSNYLLQHYMPVPMTIYKMGGYTSHVPCYEINDSTLLDSSHLGNYVAKKLATNATLKDIPEGIAGVGTMSVPTTVVTGDVFLAQCTWPNYPTGRLRLEFQNTTGLNSGDLYTVMSMRGLGTGTDYIINLTANIDGTWNQFSSDSYNATTNPFTGNQTFTIKATKETSSTTKWEILYNNGSVFFSKTSTDHDDSRLTEVDSVGVNAVDGSTFSYIFSVV